MALIEMSKLSSASLSSGSLRVEMHVEDEDAVACLKDGQGGLVWVDKHDASVIIPFLKAVFDLNDADLTDL